MSDREEREEHIKRLEAALACEEKQSSGKCSKQTCDDNCALLYEQGNWGEWKETLKYAINSLKIDLKYDLLYEETSGQADKPTTKNDLEVDCKINVLDDFIEYAKKTFGVELTFKKSDNPDTYEKLFGTTKNNLGVDWESYKDVDGNSLDDLILEVLQNNFDCGNTYGYKVADEIIGLLPSVTPQEPKSEWEHDHEILKAYSDGQASIITVLEDIKAEMENLKDNRCFCHHYERGINECINVLNKHMESEDKE